ncbi:MAG: helix-turn-helix domain-containing protein [Alkalispirochaeta sp.]
MKTKKTYESVGDLLRDITDDNGQFAAEVESQIAGQSLAATLFEMRNKVGITQEELAKRMGISQSAVSKLEHAPTDSISVHDLEQYASAVGVDLLIVFQSQMTAAERVKYHFFEIKKHLDEMRQLAADDADIVDGVDDFYNQWMRNTLRHFLEGKLDLAESKRGRDSSSSVRVVGPTEPPDTKQLEDLLSRLTPSG